MRTADPALLALVDVLAARAALGGDAPIAFLNAGLAPALPTAWRARLIAVQPSKPEHDALAAAGWATAPAAPAGCAAALVRLGRSRERSLADVAAAFDAALPGAPVMIAGENAHGPRGIEHRLRALAIPVAAEARRHARVLRLARPATLPAALAAWRDFGHLRPIGVGAAVSAPGLFAWDRVDAGTALLLETLDAPLVGTGADLGCGWGALTLGLLARHPAIARVDAFDADALAVDAARRNLAADPRARAIWHDVAAGLPARDYDWIAANPPFHDARGADVGLGRAFLAAAADALKPGGRFVLVANRTLPYERDLARRFASIETLASRDGFKVLQARRQSVPG